MDYAAWIDGVFAAAGARAGAAVRGSGAERAIGRYLVSHDEPRSEIGDILWYVAVVDKRASSAGRRWLVDAFDWQTVPPARVADEILATIAKLEEIR